jgi:hypothetical protein
MTRSDWLLKNYCGGSVEPRYEADREQKPGDRILCPHKKSRRFQFPFPFDFFALSILCVQELE